MCFSACPHSLEFVNILITYKKDMPRPKMAITTLNQYALFNELYFMYDSLYAF